MFFTRKRLHQMQNDNQMLDRRRHPRCSPEGCIMVADQKIGRIIDISRDGMAFYYADRTPWPHASLLSGRVRPWRAVQG